MGGAGLKHGVSIVLCSRVREPIWIPSGGNVYMSGMTNVYPRSRGGCPGRTGYPAIAKDMTIRGFKTRI